MKYKGEKVMIKKGKKVMKVGDKVWTWNHWYNLDQIEIHSIEVIDRMEVVNGYLPPDWLSYTKEEAKEKLKVFIHQQINVKKGDIKYLKGKLKGIQ